MSWAWASDMGNLVFPKPADQAEFAFDGPGNARQPLGDLLDGVPFHLPQGHVAQLGVITRSWSYRNRGETAPDVEIAVELTGPDGAVHRWGPEHAAHRVTGDLEDFCLVVTQRRHLDDTALRVTDGPAREWLLIAQVFAGGPTSGPAPKKSQPMGGVADTS